VNDELRQLYQAIIVDHSKAPRHRGPLPGATHEATVDNPLCGDEVTLRLVVDGDDGGRIRAAAFEGRGCAVSQAAASVLVTRLAGVDLDEARALVDRFASFVGEPPEAAVPAELGDLGAFAGVRAFRSRQVCATLVAQAFLRATRDRG